MFTADPTAAMRAVAQLAAEPFVAGSLENHHIVEHTAGHFTLKKLIHNDATRISNGESGRCGGEPLGGITVNTLVQ